jgi:hypothetical protein
VLDIGDDIGALIVYTGEALVGREIEVSPKENAARRTHTEVLERRVNGRTAFAGVFPALPAGEYSLWRDVLTDEDITIAGGSIAERDWRDIGDASEFRMAQPDDLYAGLSQNVLPVVPSAVLPPRYRDGRAVSAAPMGSAPMCYTDEGEVAWDHMWTSFCDLALAGGPKHRPTLLEPASTDEVLVAPDAYAYAVAQIERGLRLVTGLPTVLSETLGWVGLQCDDDAMAQWHLRAIAVENVSVRREGARLFLPAAPSYGLEKEIKNVVTVVAKTHHYWLEHRNG